MTTVSAETIRRLLNVARSLKKGNACELKQGRRLSSPLSVSPSDSPTIIAIGVLQEMTARN